MKPLFVLFLTVALSACATFKDQPTAARLAVTVATLKVIESGNDQVARAERVSTIAKEAKQFLSGESVSVSVLEQAVRDRIAADADLAPSDRLLADALVSTIAAELKARVGDGLLNPDQRLVVNTVLDWVVVASGG